MYLSLTLAKLQAQQALQRSGTPSSVAVETLLITDNSTLPALIYNFLTTRGITVMPVEKDPMIETVRSTWSDHDAIVNVKKLASLWRDDWQYAAIFNVDWDNFFFNPIEDYLTPAAQTGAFTVNHGSMTPTNGGFFVARPSAQLRNSITSALSHGFSLNDGWGGNYTPEDLLIAKKYSDKYCDSNMHPGCCSTAPRSPWCFAASNVDQGLLFHLAIDGGRKQGFPMAHDPPSLHLATRPKAWQMDAVGNIRTDGSWGPEKGTALLLLGEIQYFWETLGPLLPILDGDAVCGPFFKEQYAMYRKQEQSITSKLRGTK
jgi:hypothetical protein